MVVLTYREKKYYVKGGREGERQRERKSSILHLYFVSQNTFSISRIDSSAETDE